MASINGADYALPSGQPLYYLQGVPSTWGGDYASGGGQPLGGLTGPGESVPVTSLALLPDAAGLAALSATPLAQAALVPLPDGTRLRDLLAVAGVILARIPDGSRLLALTAAPPPVFIHVSSRRAPGFTTRRVGP
jgi:hypothetical protein